jgi:hypothetical protein
MGNELDPSDFENLSRDVMTPLLEQDPPPKKSSNRGRGNSKKAAAETPPPADFLSYQPVPVPEQPIQTVDPEEEAMKKKQKLLDKVYQYKEKFKKLKSRNKITGKSSVEEINDEIHYIEEQLGGGGEGGNSLLFVASMHALEYTTENVFNPLNLKLKGLGAVTSENIDQFTPLLDELVIKYGLAIAMSVEARLAVLVATTVCTVHAANSGNETVAAALSKMSDFQGKVNGTAPSNYNDL